MDCWKVTRGIVLTLALSVAGKWLMPDTPSAPLPVLSQQSIEIPSLSSLSTNNPGVMPSDEDVVVTAHALQQAGAFGSQ